MTTMRRSNSAPSDAPGGSAAPAPRDSRARQVPAFALYGEAAAPGLDLLHIEDIQSRSAPYHWEIEPHTHRGLYQVIWVGQGSVQARLDEWSGEAAGPAAIVIPPGVVHGFRFAPGTQGMVLTLSASFVLEGELQSLGDALRALFQGPRVVRFDDDAQTTRRMQGLLAQLHEACASPGQDEGPVARWLAQAALWRLAQGCAQAGERGRARHHQALFTRFMLLVEENYPRHWPVSRYADVLGLSVPRLNRLSRQESGRAALELIHERLTREACRRLVYIAAPVASLAHALGFEDPAYFCRFFKRRTGMSPSEYRAAHG